jgi:putative ABC transport system permease protein
MTALAPERATAPPLPPSRLAAADLLRVGSMGLRSRRLRAGLSALGIAIGIAAIVAVLGISSSNQADLLAQLDRLGTNLLQVQAGMGIGAGGNTDLPATAETQIRNITPVEAVSSVSAVDATVLRTPISDTRATGGISVKAARTNLLATIGGSMAHGQFLDAATERYPVAVLGAVAAERLGITDLTGAPAVSIGGRLYPVGGILAELPLAPDIDRSVLVGYPAAATYTGHDGAISTVYVVASPDYVEDVRDVLPTQANPANPENVEVSRPSDALAARAAAKGAFTSLFLGLGAVALLVGGVGIANVMVISVLERRGEIGLRRSLGATRGHIRAQFFTESLLLAALGGIGGVALGSAITLGYAATQGQPVVVPLTAIGAGVGAALLIGALAGLYPAARAARLSPTEALRIG